MSSFSRSLFLYFPYISSFSPMNCSGIPLYFPYFPLIFPFYSSFQPNKLYRNSMESWVFYSQLWFVFSPDNSGPSLLVPLHPLVAWMLECNVMCSLYTDLPNLSNLFLFFSSFFSLRFADIAPQFQGAWPFTSGGPACTCSSYYFESEEKLDILIGMYFKVFRYSDRMKIAFIVHHLSIFEFNRI